MAESRKDNLKALFSNTRSRVIIVFTAIILIISILIGIFKFTSIFSNKNASLSSYSGAPAIQSVPGAINPTQQYATLQEEQNITQASKAVKSGGSAIPTIIRTQEFGKGVESVGPQGGTGGVGFETLARQNVGPEQTLWFQSLKDSNCSPASVKSAVNQGAALSDLRKACNCIQLKTAGYKFSDLKSSCNCKELKAAGFNARQMKDAGYSAARLRECGFDACELRAAGFTAQELKDGGFSDGELKGAGYGDQDIAQASGLPNGVTEADIRNAGCGVAALKKLRAQGVSAAAIRRISGCSAAQLKAAGYSAQDLKNAGFSAADLLKAGFTPDELRQAGFNARDLLDAGLTPADLAAAGFSPAQIKDAENELPAGMTAADIQSAGCSVEALKRERLAGVSAKLIHKYAGCTAAQLKAAGFTDDDLANAGFSPAQIKGELGDDAIKAAGCDPTKLRQLFLQGVSAKRIHDLNGCTAKQLAAAGFSPEQLLAAGFTPEQIKEAGISDASIKASDCNPEKLKELFKEGVSAKRIRDLNGCTAAQLRAAGFSAKDLADAGFSPQDLLAAGFTPQQLLAAGLSPSAVFAAGRTANCSVESLKAARALGVTAATIKQTLGCSAKQLKDAGYTAAELRAAGFTAAELKAAGFSAADLKNAGFSAKELAAAGFSEADLKNAGYSQDDLKEAGFQPAASKVATLEKVTTAPPVPNKVISIPTLPGTTPVQNAATNNAKQLQEIINRQQRQMADQQYQQQIQQRTQNMVQAATQLIAQWKVVPNQVYTAGTKEETSRGAAAKGGQAANSGNQSNAGGAGPGAPNAPNLIQAGEVLFAVMDTSVNSDEPGPILATIVSGKLNGAKLIGSFNLPSNAEKMTITFNTLSIPGAAKTISINAYAIDPNTARTALSSRTNHHYLARYGALFASTFLEGFGNAFQSANTTITIGGTGGGAGGTNTTTVQSGIGRSVLENAVIGLATVGKTWGQFAQQGFSRPTTVQLFSGTGVGILFTQDVQGTV